MPWPSPAELGRLGFAHVSYPASLMFRVTSVMSETLAALRAHADGRGTMAQDARAGSARQTLDEALELERWQRVERDFQR
jgi:2-methylisocitrate lyase-like PEP mutase family enzyme